MKVKPATMVRNFELKTRMKFKEISNVIFKYATKYLAAERECNVIKGKLINDVVKLGLYLAATRIFKTVKHLLVLITNIKQQ